MPSPTTQTIRHVFNGGWATDFGQHAEVTVSDQGLVQVPFLLECLNNTFELNGGTHKIGGTTRAHSNAVASGGTVTGLFDFWRHSGGSAVRKLVIHAGANCYAADLGSEFSSIGSGLSSGAVPSYETFDDFLIIGSTGDVPKSYDQTTFQNLAGSPPNFAFSETHKNRLWAAGVATAPSKLYYSALLDPEDWTGSGSGAIDIDPNDGDAITALASHKDNLWVFKGPNKGSIHRIVGSAPTGGDSFGRVTFVRGMGAAAHNTMFRFKDDLGFMWSDGSIHSLNATAAYGDFNESALSRPINNWIREHINGNRLKNMWAMHDSVRGYVLFAISIDTSSTNNHHLMMDYRFDPPRWSHWNAYTSGCVASVIDVGVPSPFGGSNDGYVRRLQRSAKSVDGSAAIPCDTTLPFLHYANPMNFKQFSRAAVGISPKGNYDLIFGWTRDDNAEQTESVSQGQGGTVLDSFTLGTDTLAGATYGDRFMSLAEGGEFRQIRYRVASNLVDEDLELHTISASLTRGSDSGEND